MTPPPLHAVLSSQRLILSTPQSKIHFALLGTALVDALGGPAEFHRRFTFPFVDEMTENANFDEDGEPLRKGVWTDDTSMVLCLGWSIATFKSRHGLGGEAGDGFDEADQLDAYVQWWRDGEMSAIGRCFDVGNTIANALRTWTALTEPPRSKLSGESLKPFAVSTLFSRKSPSSADTRNNADRQSKQQRALQKITKDISKPAFSGNGSLMRVIPVGLAYYRYAVGQKGAFDESGDRIVRALARRSSTTTHPNELCQEACEVWTGAIVRILHRCEAAAVDSTPQFSKLDLLQYFSTFPYTQKVLQDALAITLPPESSSKPEVEEYYWTHHPLLLKVSTSAKQTVSPPSSAPAISLPSGDALPSTGYVFHTLIAALYAFFASSSFEEGAIMCVNMGDDADTVGAVYGGLAGCWYGCNKSESSGLFWSERVCRWNDALVKKDLIERVAKQLVEFSDTVKRN
ncbi:ADP-ribosylglycohydrolase [Pleurotus eryngii]|uniref:ADP-ribosylhydrolase ARH3 n=1 Tax=Pleurotus eryngii TaxID=5323 RepID=A0A9P6A1K1_PLEER|nr:ADP-ribosylglycohydrolase [Pleurotus eryngii]